MSNPFCGGCGMNTQYMEGRNLCICKKNRPPHEPGTLKNNRSTSIEIVSPEGDQYILRVDPGALKSVEQPDGTFKVEADGTLISYRPAPK